MNDLHLDMAKKALRIADEAVAYRDEAVAYRDDADAAERVDDFERMNARLTKASKADAEAYGILIDLAEALLASARVAV